MDKPTGSKIPNINSTQSNQFISPKNISRRRLILNTLLAPLVVLQILTVVYGPLGFLCGFEGSGCYQLFLFGPILAIIFFFSDLVLYKRNNATEESKKPSKGITLLSAIVALLPTYIIIYGIIIFSIRAVKHTEETTSSIAIGNKIKDQIQECDTAYNLMQSQNISRQSSNYASNSTDNIYKWKSGGDDDGGASDVTYMNGCQNCGNTDVYFDNSQIKIIDIHIPKNYELITEPPEHCDDLRFRLKLYDPKAEYKLDIGEASIFKEQDLISGSNKKYRLDQLSYYPDKFQEYKIDWKSIYVSKDRTNNFSIVVKLPWDNPSYKYFIYNIEKPNISQNQVDGLVDSAKITTVEGY